MEERTVLSVDPVEESDWGEAECMHSDESLSGDCQREAAKDISVEYEDEPDKTFHTLLCERCASDYLKRWDRAQIF